MFPLILSNDHCSSPEILTSTNKSTLIMIPVKRAYWVKQYVQTNACMHARTRAQFSYTYDTKIMCVHLLESENSPLFEDTSTNRNDERMSSEEPHVSSTDDNHSCCSHTNTHTKQQTLQQRHSLREQTRKPLRPNCLNLTKHGCVCVCVRV